MIAILLIAVPIAIGAPIILASSKSDAQVVKDAKETFAKLTANQKLVKDNKQKASNVTITSMNTLKFYLKKK